MRVGNRLATFGEFLINKWIEGGESAGEGGDACMETEMEAAIHIGVSGGEVCCF